MTTGRTIFLFVCLFAFYSTTFSRSPDNRPGGDADTTVYVFSFNETGDRPWSEVENYSKKYAKLFGVTVARQITLVDMSYVVYSGSGNDYRPRVIKPALYNAITQLTQYYKDQVKEEQITPETAGEELSAILIKGYACYSANTEKLEEILNEANSIEELKLTFSKIKLVNSTP